jgi:toxin ParE1/3/4
LRAASVSFRYRLSPAAVEDMEAIIDYLRERNPVVGVRFVEAAQATFEHIAFMPLAYPRMPTEKPQLADMRWRPLTGAFDRYLVFYRVFDDDLVDVVRLLRSSRNIGRVLGEE